MYYSCTSEYKFFENCGEREREKKKERKVFRVSVYIKNTFCTRFSKAIVLPKM